MADFGIRFFICNILICAIIGILLMIKKVLKNHLTSRMQFNLWFLLLGLLAVPFIPVRPVPFSQIFSLLDKWKNAASAGRETLAETAVNAGASGTARQLNDFALSVSSKTPPVIGLILFGIWITGIFAMLLLIIKSKTRLNALKKSALPLQSEKVRILYSNCLSELKIKKDIPIYSTAFLKSPIMIGWFKPCIYLPIHLISDFNAVDMRYILLHELQHYKHKDAIAGYLMNLFGVLYWFHPVVWYALKEMRSDREVACDTSVLKLLNESDYEDYGDTLINFAEKISLSSFPFAAGISGNMSPPMLGSKAIISGTYPPKRLIRLTYLHISADMKEVLFYMIYMLSRAYHHRSMQLLLIKYTYPFRHKYIYISQRLHPNVFHSRLLNRFCPLWKRLKNLPALYRFPY